jgi:hypothetical protein
MIWLLAFAFGTGGHAASAIYYSDNGNDSWTAYADWNPILTVAQEKAYEGCRKAGGINCKAVLRTKQEGCYALAVSNEGGPFWGTGVADTQKGAWNVAQSNCEKKDTNPYSVLGTCVIRKSYCDNSGGFEQDNAARLPATCGATPVVCARPRDYCHCLIQGRPITTEREREKYCRMVFC